MYENPFTNVGEFTKTRGNKKTRFGPKTSNIAVNNIKRFQNSNEIALDKLTKILKSEENIRRIPVQNSIGYINYLKDADQLDSMNLPILAEVIIYLYSVNNDLNNFSYKAIEDYIDRITNKQGITIEGVSKKALENDLAITRLRLAAEFFRYAYYVINLNQENEL